MANPNDQSMKKLNSLKAFAKDTITSFGIVVILKAVMVPPALGLTDW